MTEEFELKQISPEGLPGAMDRADHYRLLNDPGPAESICLDVLRIDPDNQRAIVTLILAITDQFSTRLGSRRVRRARTLVAKLTDEYERSYYEGLVHERQARAFLGRDLAASDAYDGFRDAMDCYETAEGLRKPGNDDALLRYNSCVRAIREHQLEPRGAPQRELPLE